MIQIDKSLIDDLYAKAKESERLRMNYDLRTSSNDGSQRMLNALLPGSIVPIHRHPLSNENVLLVCGKLVEVLYDVRSTSSGTELVETARYHLDPAAGNFGCVVPAGAWHTVEVIEPSVIYEAKDGKYGEDGSETLDEYKAMLTLDPSKAVFSNSFGDLKKNIEYLIGMERQSGSMDAISPLYVSRMLNVPLEDVEKCMKEMGV
jgi:cupin fold WbuC family metalloprotein